MTIGVAILSQSGELMSTGQNQIYNNGDGLLAFHQIAHAEINAILKLSEIKDLSIQNNIRSFTLYSTMEPCPLCFGAIVMGSIRNVKYAAKDGYAGATSLNTSLAYIRNKKINIQGPFEIPQTVQIAMQTCFELQRATHAEVLLSSFSQYCEKGVLIGKKLYEKNILQDMILQNFEHVYNYIIQEYNTLTQRNEEKAT